MRIRNILIKTHNPALNPSLQNHLHSSWRRADDTLSSIVVPSLTPHPGLRLPLSLLLSLDDQDLDAAHCENSAFVCTSMLSPI